MGTGTYSNRDLANLYIQLYVFVIIYDDCLTIRMYVCQHACMYVRISCIYVRTEIHVSVCLYTCMYVGMYADMRALALTPPMIRQTNDMLLK
jgi:hypothetical protein